MNARVFADRVRIGVEVALNSKISVTVSIGVAVADRADRDIEDTIERADRGLDMARNTGRKRVFFMPVLVAVPSGHAA